MEWLRRVRRRLSRLGAPAAVPPGLVGEWQSENSYQLVIGGGGQGSYGKMDFLSAQPAARPAGQVRVVGNALIVRTWLRQNYFAIDKPPFCEGRRCKMVLNGVVFSRLV